ncbi:MAG: hypothetical protein K2Y37_01765 [Pirellulales bacterium]|nr:hypothetical protein [Pirellulales bacterium]
MKPTDLFGVVVRTSGLIACFYGLDWFLALFMARDNDAAPVPDLLIAMIGYMVVGIVLFMYADFFVAISYRPKEEEEEEEPESELDAVPTESEAD